MSAARSRRLISCASRLEACKAIGDNPDAVTMLSLMISWKSKKREMERRKRSTIDLISQYILSNYMVSASILLCTGRSSSTEEEELHSSKRHRLAHKKSQISYPGERKGFRSMKVKCCASFKASFLLCIIARNKV